MPGGSFEANNYNEMHIIQIYCGITSGRVLNGELYTQRIQELIDLYLSTDCFVKISLYSSGPTACRQICKKKKKQKLTSS